MRAVYTFVIVSLFLEADDLQANVIHAGPGQAIRTLRAALDVAAAGDTILLGPGTFREGNVIIQKSITIIGNGNPVLDGDNKYEILTINADHVVIQDITFANTGVASISDIAAVKVLDSKGVHVRRNRFENAYFGIYFANSTSSSISGNEVVSTRGSEHQRGNGIHLWKCDSITIDDNSIRGHRDGIYFEFVTGSVITNNHSEENLRYGLHFMFSHDDEYRNNTFVNNGAGVAVMYTKGVTMTGNTFLHNWGSASYGLLLKDIRDSHVSGNRFIENSVGIFMEGSSRIRFRENIFERNGYAVRMQASCDGNVFERNDFKANTFDLATNGSLVLNKIDNNYWDKYEGYDLDKDRVGDIPFRPVSLYAMVVEQMPAAVLLWRSFFVLLMDRAEKVIPAMTPEGLQDHFPHMHPYAGIR
jgi:nitrous oxidase accessory protein